jgi:hypothetical protein
MIEPIDSIEIGAWAAKAQGILGLAQKALHFEFPLYATLDSSKARDAYKDILTLLLNRVAATLRSTNDPEEQSMTHASTNREHWGMHGETLGSDRISDCPRCMKTIEDQGVR